MKTITKLARYEDIPSLICLEKICFTTDHLSVRQFRHFITHESASVAILKQDDTIIGCAITLFRKNSKISRLYSFALDPRFRGRGLAQILYDYIEVNISAHRCKEIRLEVRVDNMTAIRFYEKNGFVIFADLKKFYKDNSNAYCMVKKLG